MAVANLVAVSVTEDDEGIDVVVTVILVCVCVYYITDNQFFNNCILNFNESRNSLSFSVSPGSSIMTWNLCVELLN